MYVISLPDLFKYTFQPKKYTMDGFIEKCLKGEKTRKKCLKIGFFHIHTTVSATESVQAWKMCHEVWRFFTPQWKQLGGEYFE
jgi:hypothetical protein